MWPALRPAQRLALRFALRPALRPVIRPVLRPAAKYVAGHSTQLQREPSIVFHVYVRSIVFMLIHTQHANDIAENFVEILVHTQGKYKYVKIGVACGLRPAT